MNATNVRLSSTTTISVKTAMHGAEYTAQTPTRKAVIPTYEMIREPRVDKRSPRRVAAV